MSDDSVAFPETERIANGDSSTVPTGHGTYQVGPFYELEAIYIIFTNINH